MAAQPSGCFERVPDGGVEPARETPHRPAHPHTLLHLQAAASPSGRCSGRAIPLAGARGRTSTGGVADAPAPPCFFATCDGTVIATSVPVPVPQPSAESQSALKLKRTNSSLAQEVYERQNAGRFVGPSTKALDAAELSGASGVAIAQLQALLSGATDFEKRIKALVEGLVPRCLDGGNNACNVQQLGFELRALGYSVWVRTAVGGGGSEWFRHLKHSFLLVEGDPQFPDQLYVVDPNFRDQFVIARSTRQFNRVIHSLPAVFVGRGKKLLPTVQLVCSEIAIAFSELEMEIPPWRKKSSMISKWMPERKSDYVPGTA